MCETVALVSTVTSEITVRSIAGPFTTPANVYSPASPRTRRRKSFDSDPVKNSTMLAESCVALTCLPAYVSSWALMWAIVMRPYSVINDLSVVTPLFVTGIFKIEFDHPVVRPLSPTSLMKRRKCLGSPSNFTSNGLIAYVYVFLPSVVP